MIKDLCNVLLWKLGNLISMMFIIRSYEYMNCISHICHVFTHIGFQIYVLVFILLVQKHTSVKRIILNADRKFKRIQNISK